MPSLRLTAPGHPPTVYNLHKKITSLGSGPDNDIVLPDPLVTDGYAVHFDGMRKLLTYLTEDCCQGQPELCGTAFKKSRMLCTSKGGKK